MMTSACRANLKISASYDCIGNQGQYSVVRMRNPLFVIFLIGHDIEKITAQQ